MIRRLSLARKLALAFSIGPLIFLIVGWVTHNNISQLDAARLWVTHTHEVIERTNALLLKLVDAETGERGFLLTGEDPYLDPYRQVLSSIDNDQSALAALVADNPVEEAHVQSLRPLIATKLDVLKNNIDLRQNKGADAALAVMQSGKGKDVMDKIRAIVGDIVNTEYGLLRQRDADSTQITQVTNDVILYGTAIGFALLALIGVFATRSIAGPIGEAVAALASATTEILAATTQQASGMEEQASAVAETVSTINEIAQTSQQANERVKAVAEASHRAVEISNSGRQAVTDSVSAMNTVKESTESVAQSILRLAEQAHAIGEIIAAVNDIAEQTNLLALNAAIEASRAGEHGRGFSVVAGGIKSLADESKKATAQVRQILGEIQKATTGAVMAAEEGSKSVGGAIRTVNQAGNTIRQLADTIAESAGAATQVTASVGQQGLGIGQIQTAMRNISDASSQNLASTRQAEQTAHNLDQVGQQLKALLTGAAA